MGFSQIFLLVWNICAIGIVCKGPFMHITSSKIALAVGIAVLALSSSIALHAAELQGGSIPLQEPAVAWAGTPCLQSDGTPNACGTCLAERTNITWLGCLHHPTAIYHPAVYNYRYYFNIVGHETDARPGNCRGCLPAAHPPQENFIPIPEQQGRSSQAAGSARLSWQGQRKFQK
jgi:hypothetical protein